MLRNNFIVDYRQNHQDAEESRHQERKRQYQKLDTQMSELRNASSSPSAGLFKSVDKSNSKKDDENPSVTNSCCLIM